VSAALIARRVAAAAISGVVAFMSPASSLADSNPAGERFADLINRSPVVVLASVTVRPDEGLMLHVERVLKGVSPHDMVFEPPTMAPVLDNGGRAVIAFRDLATIDSRAPTYAWIVATDGKIDPGGLQQYPGLPATLDAMLDFFNIAPGSSTPELQSPAPASESSVFPWAAVTGAAAAGIAVAVAGGLLVLRRRRVA
jgi:hypothetical protein